jgi:hypothetical protein
LVDRAYSWMDDTRTKLGGEIALLISAADAYLMVCVMDEICGKGINDLTITDANQAALDSVMRKAKAITNTQLLKYIGQVSFNGVLAQR